MYVWMDGCEAAPFLFLFCTSSGLQCLYIYIYIYTLSHLINNARIEVDLYTCVPIYLRTLQVHYLHLPDVWESRASRGTRPRSTPESWL